jgi:hypothetical protein
MPVDGKLQASLDAGAGDNLVNGVYRQRPLALGLENKGRLWISPAELPEGSDLIALV